MDDRAYQEVRNISIRGRRKASKVQNKDLIYLATISNKYDMDPSELLNSIRIALNRGKYSSGRLEVHHRGSINKQSIFLIQLESEVVAQLRLADKFVLDIERNREALQDVKRFLKPKEREKQGRTIGELQIGSKQICLTAKVIEKTPTRKVLSRLGNPLLISTITISDGTGSIKIPLWNKQIDEIAVGDTIQIENGKVKSFRGERQLTLSPKSKLVVLT